MAELFRLEQPTIIGTQEGLYGQLRDIAGGPARTTTTGSARGARAAAATSSWPIFFDTRRLEPVEFDHFWLSDTPDVVGSNTWGNDSVRMVTWVRFHDKRTGKEFVVLDTHLDDESAYSRVRAAGLIRDRIATFPPDLPVIVTGDFNDAAPSHAAPYDILTDGDRSHRRLARREGAGAARRTAPGTPTTRSARRPAHRLGAHQGPGDGRRGRPEHVLPQGKVPVRPPAAAGAAAPRLTGALTSGAG